MSAWLARWSLFQSTPLHEGRLASGAMENRAAKFQSTHLHEGRRATGKTTAICDVSIHAPARGATYFQPAPRFHRGVSIHAPARGATIVRIIVSIDVRVSIHAPARGATESAELAEAVGMFQSTPLHEGRRGTGMSSCGTEFQSTPLHEGRQPNSNPYHYIIIVSIHAPARGATASWT